MHSIQILLPDVVFTQASLKAKSYNSDVSTYCSGVLSEHFLSAEPPKNLKTAPSSLDAGKFDVASLFFDFPKQSVIFAQQFVDEALIMPHKPKVRAFQNRNGIGFDPNFVFIEYLMRRRFGIAISFYGEPHRHKNPPLILRRGIPSYSRARVNSQAELDLVLPHIRQSYELKFGS